ncbi:polysaccharide pyruvyl transferase family protein [Thioclava sp. GXIMD2076]|uniref:polysaccharide pyruvyl transferase family protein n=1 Tax=Thioclava sp. GXIMD2076 TaxID=3131931 RepID=UPI0030CEFAB4
MRNVLEDFLVDEERLIVNANGEVPLVYWPVTPNFGDDMSQWLMEKLTSKRVVRAAEGEPCYVAIGSIINRVTNEAQVWGTGSFGPEPPRQVNPRATYHAVRGPLTRARVLDRGRECPRVYGDPALLAPLFFQDNIPKDADIGIAIRWSDDDWKKLDVGSGIKLIDFGTSDVEGTLRELLSCKKIITSSLHGLIIADTYGIPSAWLSSTTPKGGEFKFYDYFLSVDKVRHTYEVRLQDIELTVEALETHFNFDARPINFDPRELLGACPFLKAAPSNP